MLARSSFKAELVAYRESLKPPKVPGSDGVDGVGNRNRADLELLNRLIADERVEELWKKIKSTSGLPAQELIRTVLRARCSAQASVNRIYGQKLSHWSSAFIPSWSDALNDLRERTMAELSRPPSVVSALDVAETFDRAANEARLLHKLFFNFSDHLGLPDQSKFSLSRKDQGGTRVRKLFMQIMTEFLTTKAGRPFDHEVGVLTEIAFLGRNLDKEDVTAARKPRTAGKRRAKPQ
jgi:hypothetical protein